MKPIFWYFLKRTLTNEYQKEPICSVDFLGYIGDFIEIDGIGYIITDYAIDYEKGCDT